MSLRGAGFVDFTNPKTVDCEEPASFAVRPLPKIVASKLLNQTSSIIMKMTD